MKRWLLFKREIQVSLRRGHATATLLAFALMVFTVFALSLGPDALRGSAASILAATLLLSTLLALPQLFERDAEEGTLEQYLLQPGALEWLMLVKIAALWVMQLLPLVICAPLPALMAGLEPAQLPALIAPLLLGSASLACLGALGAALTLGLRQGAATQTLILLPLYMPVLIFMASGSSAFALLMLTAIMLAALPLCCFACAWLIRVGYE
jgi:heme exporter protein B